MGLAAELCERLCVLSVGTGEGGEKTGPAQQYEITPPTDVTTLLPCTAVQSDVTVHSLRHSGSCRECSLTTI